MRRPHRFLTSALIALAVGLTVNVVAARLDARSDDERRSAAEHDLRARLAARGVSDARVQCQTGMTCTVTLPDGRTAQVDPRDP
jgi:preprotein translocase subunit SecD